MTQKNVSLEKKIYLAKKKVFPQLEVVVDVLLALEESVRNECDKDGISHDFLFEWVCNELPSVRYDKPLVEIADETDEDSEEDWADS